MKKWYEIKSVGEEAEIFLYEEIGIWGITAKDFADDLKALKNIKRIALRINSPGGNVFDGAAIYNTLRRHSAHVTTHIDGLAASMASVIAMAGDTIKMSGNALIMIHNPFGGAYGDAEDMRKTADLLDKIKSTIVSSYQTKTTFSEDELKAMMDAETWLDSEEALAFGFVDEVTESLEMAASFDLSKFKNAPQPKQKNDLPAAPKGVNSQSSAVADKNKDVIMTDKTSPTANPVDKEKIAADAKAEGIKAEAGRVSGIRGVFAQFEDHREIMDKCIDDVDVSVEDARELLLNALGKGKTSAAQDAKIEMGESASERFRNDAIDAVAMRTGEKPTESKNDLRSRSLLELARMSIEVSGKSAAGMDKMGIVGFAMTSTSDFPYILSTSANKAMQKGYEEAPETYQIWTSKGNLADFKIADRNVMSLFSDLEEVKEGAEYKHGTFSEGREQIQLLTYGKKFSITRQAIINDDLNAFTVIPMRMGRAARRQVGDLAYAVLTANAAMADGVVLFHSSHSNLSASAAAPSTTTVDAARTAMKTQTDPSGNGNLNIMPKFLLVPVAYEGVALDVMDSKTRVDGGANDPNKPNNVRGLATVVSDARLDSASATDWYMAADPAVHDTVEVAFLDGNDAPTLEQQNGWDIDGVEFKVRIDAAAKALDHRGLYLNS